MDYKQFENIFNTTIFEKSKPDLLEKIAKYPQRYVGIFRPTKPYSKVLQNLFQSHEIRFGDAFETLIERVFELEGYSLLDKRIVLEDKVLELDQLFEDQNYIYFIEQKIRDDHDSSKKRGQISNFENKLDILNRMYSSRKTVKAFFYFVDSSLTKNRKYYLEQINELSKAYGNEIVLTYGEGLFNFMGCPHIWKNIISNLTSWRQNLPDCPEINFDKNHSSSFQEIKSINASIFRKLFSGDLDEVLKVLFPNGDTLSLLSEDFWKRYEQNREHIYHTLYSLCMQTAERLSK